MKEILSNPLLRNMRMQLEKDPSLMKASFYVPKGALENKTNKMVPVLVRREQQSRSDEELSTGADGSFENSEHKTKESKSKSIVRPETQVYLSKNSLNRCGLADSSLLDESAQQMLRNEDFNSLVSSLVDF